MGQVRPWIVALALAGCGRYAFEDHGTDACALQIPGTATRINFNTHRTLETTGGRAPLRFTATPSAANVATINDTTGELIAGDEPGTVTVGVTDADACAATATYSIGGDSLFYIGGSSNSVPSALVYRSTDGQTWTNVGSLPDKREFGAAIVFQNRLWYFSGTDGTNIHDDIFVTDDGVTWSAAGHVPNGASSFGFTIFKDQLYFVGGNNNAGRVYRSSDALNWTLVGSLPMDNHGGALVGLANQLIYAGGHNGSIFNWVLASPDGATWTQVGTLPTPREYASSTHVGDRMYVIGGQDTTPTAYPTVSSTLDGITWTNEPPLPVARAFGGLVRIADTLYSFGGTDGGGALIGTPSGAWTNMGSSFPIPRQGGSIVAFSPAN